jgi:hypothetical protein
MLQMLKDIGEIVGVMFVVWMLDPMERENRKPRQDRARWRNAKKRLGERASYSGFDDR